MTSDIGSHVHDIMHILDSDHEQWLRLSQELSEAYIELKAMEAAHPYPPGWLRELKLAVGDRYDAIDVMENGWDGTVRPERENPDAYKDDVR